MNTSVKLFAFLRERAGTGQTDVQLPENTTVSDLLKELNILYPSLLVDVASIMVAVNTEYVTQEHRLHDGDEVALIPPVSGGDYCQSGPQGEAQ